MAPPRKKPLPPGAKPAPRKGSVSSAGGTHKHSSSRSKSSSAAAAAAAAALAAGTSSSTSRSKPKSKSSRVAVEQPPLPAFERMDNGMRFSSFPVVYNINQKNYYTDYLKKDDQIYTNRQVAADAKDAEAREAAAKLAPQEAEEPDSDEETESAGSKVIVIHPGSRNLRIGFASQAFPHTIPMVIARPSAATFKPLPPLPLRLRDDPESSEPLFGAAFEEGVTKLDGILKARLKMAKKRTVPNARELVASYNRRVQIDELLDINDPEQIEWIDLGPEKKYCTGEAALRVVEDPKLARHYWPIKNGVFNEVEYLSRQELMGDIQLIIEDALKTEMGITSNDMSNYSVVLVIPDLFDKTYIYEWTRLLFQDMRFSKVAYFQESLSATFGAGISHACVVDIGAQTTTISCVDEGAVIPDSRINMKYGGEDITEYWTRLLLRGSYPWAELDLAKSVDRRVLQAAKERWCTLFESDVAMQLGESVVRNQGQKTKKFSWRMYDETFLASLAMFLPSVMGKPEKVPTRHGVIPRSTDLYDGSFNDQESGAQNAMANHWAIPVVPPTDSPLKQTNGNGPPTENPTPSRRPSPSLQSMAGDPPESVVDASRRSLSPGVVASPLPGGPNGSLSTPQTEKITRAPTPTQGQSSYFPPTSQAYDDELTVANIPSLEYAVATSIRFASLPALSSMTTTNLGEDRSRRLYSSILVVGSGAKIPGLGYMLEDRVRSLKGGTVAVIPPPRDMDPGVLVWKGASVYARLKTAERESFMTRKEWDLYGLRGIPLRLTFVF